MHCITLRHHRILVRTELRRNITGSLDELFGASVPGVVHNANYQSVGGAQAATNALCGTLHFAETRMNTSHPDSDWKGPGQTLFPAFSLSVVTHADWLIPLERDLILSGRGAGARLPLRGEWGDHRDMGCSKAKGVSSIS
jgi:hypothetical protein